MEFRETIERRLSDPDFCRELLSELRTMIEENERLRRELERHKSSEAKQHNNQED